MKFTVFGASGFIGSSLMTHFRKAGHECSAPPRGSRVALSRPLGHAIYCIGVTSDYRQRPLDAMEAHVSALLPILRRGRFQSLTYLSSTRVYHGSQISREDQPLQVLPHAPADLYAVSKLAGEAACLSDSRAGIRVVRLSNIYGPRDDSENFLNSVVNEALRKGTVIIRTAPSSAKDYLCIQDVLSGLVKIATRGKLRVYNLASGINSTNAEIARILRRTIGCRVSFAPVSPRVAFPRIDITRIRKELDFSPRPLFEGLQDLIRERRLPLSRAHL